MKLAGPRGEEQASSFIPGTIQHVAAKAQARLLRWPSEREEGEVPVVRQPREKPTLTGQARCDLSARGPTSCAGSDRPKCHRRQSGEPGLWRETA